MSDRLIHYLMQGLIDRLDCLLEQPKHIAWVQEYVPDFTFPSSVTVMSLVEALSSKERFDALVIAGALSHVEKLAEHMACLSRRIKSGGSLFLGFYALDTVKEYTSALNDAGLPVLQPFLDMHDVADIVMGECVTDVVSDNDTIQLPALAMDDWLMEMSNAMVLPALSALASSHKVQLPDPKSIWCDSSKPTTIEMGFIHGVYQPKSKEQAPGVHAISIDAIGGRSAQ